MIDNYRASPQLKISSVPYQVQIHGYFMHHYQTPVFLCCDSRVVGLKVAVTSWLVTSWTAPTKCKGDDVIPLNTNMGRETIALAKK